MIDSAGSHDIVAADLDGDGDLDIVGANHAGVHPVVIWEISCRLLVVEICSIDGQEEN